MCLCACVFSSIVRQHTDTTNKLPLIVAFAMRSPHLPSNLLQLMGIDDDDDQDGDGVATNSVNLVVPANRPSTRRISHDRSIYCD